MCMYIMYAYMHYLHIHTHYFIIVIGDGIFLKSLVAFVEHADQNTLTPAQRYALSASDCFLPL